jgi:hypothetical protein
VEIVKFFSVSYISLLDIDLFINFGIIKRMREIANPISPNGIEGSSFTHPGDASHA